MKNQDEKNSTQHPMDKLNPTVKTCLNVGLSAFVITNMICLFKLPIDKILQQATKNSLSSLDYRSLKSLGLLVGMSTYIRTSMPRSCYVIYSKNSSHTPKTREIEMECSDAIEATQEVLNSKRDIKQNIKHLRPFINIPFLAAGETIFTHTPDQITVLKQQNVNYDTKKFANYLAMTKAGLGIRYTSSLINLLCLTHIQKFYAQTLFDGSSQKVSSHLLTGALSGITAAFINHPLKQILLQSTLSATVDKQNTYLSFDKTSSILKRNIAELRQQSILETMKETLPKLSFRALQSALVFGVTIAMSELLGDNPIEKAYNQIQPFVAAYKK